ncbi:MAG: hypothetical protein EHM70_05190 [Chloroflexota bacterium]|nr:MAG: hypothetical protein EHM70_05190 [Chloroflexota bacterium]
MLAQLQAKYPDEVNIVYRHYPLIGTPERPFHDKAALSAQAAEAAGRQDKFWEMHDLLFERQSEWVSLTVADFQTWLIEAAGELDLDTDQFTEDLNDPANVAEIKAAWDTGNQIGLPGTPFLLIDGRIWPNNVPMDMANLSAVVELTQLEEKQFTECPPMTVDPLKQYTATLHTNKGDIKIELFADVAPMAVNSFIFLVNNGWFDGITFHRVVPNFVAQAGDPTGTGYGGPGYAFDNEVSAGLKFDQPGIVGMANAGPGSNGSQFFITYAPAPQLDGGYTIFGKVIEGMDVATSLTPRNPAEAGVLPEGDIIESVTIEEK